MPPRRQSRHAPECCGAGWFVEPTIFAGVKSEMRIANEEVFGPLLSLIPFDDEEEAIHIANSTIYGLAAGTWTRNIRRAFMMSERLEAGTVWINCYRAVSYMSPFGGYKRSGIGRRKWDGSHPRIPAKPKAYGSTLKEHPQTRSYWGSHEKASFDDSALQPPQPPCSRPAARPSIAANSYDDPLASTSKGRSQGPISP